MKAGVTYVPVEEFLDIAKKRGCSVELQAGFHKVTKEGAQAILYVSKTQSCGRIDISNTMIAGHDDEVENLGNNSYGKVKQRVNFGGPALNGQQLPGRSKEQVLEFFTWLVDNLATFEPLARKERQRPVGLKGSKQRKPSEAPEIKVQMEQTPAQQIEGLLAHKRRLEETAVKHNMKVSPKTMAAIVEKLKGLGYTGPEVQA